MSKIKGTLENWGPVLDAHDTLEDFYLDRDRKVVCVIGNVYGHKTIKDGTLITTSLLIRFDFKLKLLYTTNSIYRLGKILE